MTTAKSASGRSAWLGIGFTAFALVSGLAAADDHDHPHSLLVLTSSNTPGQNNLIVFKLDATATHTLSLSQIEPTGGAGGAGGNAGIVQFQGDLGAVANFGSNSVTTLARHGDYIDVVGHLNLASGCLKPDSVALNWGHLFVVGSNCAQSFQWPSGYADGTVVHLTDASAGQIAVGRSWAAVTLKSGSVLQLPLTGSGSLSGAATPISLPADADNTPLGEAFWNDTLGFTPAHSPDSFAIVNRDRTVYPVAGPTPSFPSNATCWVAKGRGNIWYTGHSPGEAISIFFSDGAGGVFYKSVPVPGVPTDLTVSPDGKWLAAIYTANGMGYVAAFSIDSYGGLTLVATSEPAGVAAFNGIAISE